MSRVTEDGLADLPRPDEPDAAAAVPDPAARGTRSVIRLEGDVPSPANPPSGCRFRTRCWKAQAYCVTDEPALIPRPDADPHPSACHFAERG